MVSCWIADGPEAGLYAGCHIRRSDKSNATIFMSSHAPAPTANWDGGAALALGRRLFSSRCIRWTLEQTGELSV